MIGSLSWRMFWVVCGVIASVLIVQIHVLLPLYLSAETRTCVRTTVEGTAAREGWLLSDLSLRRVGNGFTEIEYRPHVRGVDERYCNIINTYDTLLSPCVL